MHLINSNDKSFIKFCQELDLEPLGKALTVQLVKVFCKDSIDAIMMEFSQREKEYIESHQKNRASVIFTMLLRFQKLGDV